MPETELLTAQPSAWPEGLIEGLCARGGFEVDLEWEDSEVAKVAIRALRGGAVKL